MMLCYRNSRKEVLKGSDDIELGWEDSFGLTPCQRYLSKCALYTRNHQDEPLQSVEEVSFRAIGRRINQNLLHSDI